MTIKKQKMLGIIIAVVSSFAYGAYPPAVRAVYAAGGNTTFMLLAAMFARMACLTLFCVFTGRKLFANKQDTKIGIEGGIYQAIAVLGLFGSLVYLPGPICIIIIFTHTLMLLFYMAWKKEIQLNAAIITTTAAALVGLSFALDIWHAGNTLNLIGVGLAFASALTNVVRLYMFGKQSLTRHPIVIGAETFVVGFLLIVVTALFMTPTLPSGTAAYGWVLAACISQVLGTFGMFYGIALLGAFEFSLLAKTEPLFTALFSYLFINEVLHFSQYMGILLVISSLVFYQYLDHKNKKAA